MDELSVAMGKNIRKIREKNEISLDQLARSIGACKDNVYRWEKGFICPSAYYLLRITRALDCTFEELCEGTK